MLGFSVLKAKQPPGVGKVIEIRVKNWVALLFRAKHLVAITLPFFGGVVFVVYFLGPDEEIQPQVRVHEFIHVEQARRPGPFYIEYFKSVIEGHGYMGSKLEKEAYRAQQDAQKSVPDWAAI